MTQTYQTEYKLHNRSTGCDLKHPKYGIWHAKDLSEANEILKACHEYLRTIGLDFLLSKIIIKTIRIKK